MDGCSELMELIVASSASKWFDNCTRSDCCGCIRDEHGHHMQHHVQQSILCCVGTDGDNPVEVLRMFQQHMMYGRLLDIASEADPP